MRKNLKATGVLDCSKPTIGLPQRKTNLRANLRAEFGLMSDEGQEWSGGNGAPEHAQERRKLRTNTTRSENPAGDPGSRPWHVRDVMAASPQVRPLFIGQSLLLLDIRWSGEECRVTPERAFRLPGIIFQRRGAFVANGVPRPVVCDPNTLMLIEPGEDFGLSRGLTEDCAGTVLLVDPGALSAILGEYGKRPTRRPDKLVVSQTVQSRPELVIVHFALRFMARSSGRVSSSAIEEFGLRLAARVFDAARRGASRRSRRLRPSTVHAHAETARSVRETLALRFRERLTLSAIARIVHCAPGHLCRVFKQQTGVSIHRYLTRLRLATAIDDLVEARRPLGPLALELGFSTHSHFSTAFRAEFGIPPSRLREKLANYRDEKVLRLPQKNDAEAVAV